MTPDLTCKDVAFEVSVSASANYLEGISTNSTAETLIRFVDHALTTGEGFMTGEETHVKETYIINARYCPPKTQVPGRDTTLQFLVHGNGANRMVWNGPDMLSNYSWVDYATSQGHSALAVDVLGHGLSSKPDPVMEVQTSLEVATHHAVIDLLRSGDNPLNTSFNKIIYVGHSYGSMNGNLLAQQYPQDCDAMILAGYSAKTPFPNPNADLSLRPVSEVLPSSFVGYPPGYMAVSSLEGMIKAQFAGNFDPRIPRYGFANQDVTTVGEMGTVPLNFGVAEEYTGPVLLVTGEMDEIFCNSQFGSCSATLNETRSLFPAAKPVEYHAVPETGHALTVHLSAQDTFRWVHQWLEEYV